MRRIISMLMENEPGALSRVVGLFSQRGYNIETLVGLTDDVVDRLLRGGTVENLGLKLLVGGRQKKLKQQLARENSA